METAHHLLADYRFTRRVWNEIAIWIGLPDLQPAAWPTSSTPLEWWVTITSRQHMSCKASRSLALLINWEIWKERNCRVFSRKESPVHNLVYKVKEEFSLWLSTGAKCLATLGAQL
jgi:hypothetical protein